MDSSACSDKVVRHSTPNVFLRVDPDQKSVWTKTAISLSWSCPEAFGSVRKPADMLLMDRNVRL